MSKILLVDDSEANRLTLGSLLEDEGHQVDVAGSVSEGGTALNRADASYDIVLLDLHLGDGLGTKLVKVVRDRLPAARVMLINGSVEPDELPPDAGFDGMLAKGASFDHLVAMLKTATAGPRT